MWNFGSGSYGTDDMKHKLKGKPKKKEYTEEDEAYAHKVNMTKTVKPNDLEDDFDDLGLDSDEN